VPCNFCTYTQGAFGNTGSGGYAAMAAAIGLFPLEVGIPGVGGNSITLTTATAVADYLPAGGPAAPLTGDVTDPFPGGPPGVHNAAGSGIFGGQVTTLKINVYLNPLYGTVVFQTGGGSLFDGMTVGAILAAAEVVLGGGVNPVPGTTISGANDNSYNFVITNLNEAFDDCKVSAYVNGHLLCSGL